jgi:hypothetical protein
MTITAFATLRTFGLVAWAGKVLGAFRGAPTLERPANASQPVKPRRMGRDEEWLKLAGIVRTAVQRAEDATGFHASASQQLDLAQYALANLLDELTGVMSVPNRRGPALVRVLEKRPQPNIFGARAA